MIPVRQQQYRRLGALLCYARPILGCHTRLLRFVRTSPGTEGT